MTLPWLLKPYNLFKESYLNDRVGGSLIVEGTYGKGAYHLVHDIVKLYMCSHPSESGPCNQCKSCQLIDAGSNIDVQLILSTKNQDDNALTDDTNLLYERNEEGVVRIEHLRTISTFLNESSVINDKKVVIVQNAHLMKEQGANSILKTFEEPPINRLIILVTKSNSLLLPTILSRAFKLSIDSVDLNLARDYLLEHNVQEGDIDLALALSYNSPLYAHDLALDLISLDKDEYTFINIVKMCLHLFLNYLAKKDESLIELLSKLSFNQRMLILHELVLEILKLKARIPLENLALLQVIGQSQDYLRKNLKMRSLFLAHDFLNELYIAERNIPSLSIKANLREFLRILTA